MAAITFEQLRVLCEVYGYEVVHSKKYRENRKRTRERQYGQKGR